MLKLRRPRLDPALAAELERRQVEVDEGKAGDRPWEDFTRHEREQREAGKPTVLQALAAASHRKCAYCETDQASEIDHHWPKAPHSRLNANRGTSTRMFRWDNLVPSCRGCNSLECKGAHMRWCDDGRTMLLNPFADGDDPLCHFSVEVDDSSTFALGWIEPRECLNDVAAERATYTQKRLKLNMRDHLLKGRARVIRRFKDIVASWRVLGPDYANEPGRPVRKIFAEMLEPGEPYLCGVRQILRDDQGLRDDLLASMPELKALIEAWDLPPDNCPERLT